MPGFSLDENIFVGHFRSRITPETGRRAKCNLPAHRFERNIPPSIYIYIYIPLNEIIPQIFNFIYRSGDNRVDKSRRQRLKLPPFPSFVFFLLVRWPRKEEETKKVITRDRDSVYLSI